MRADLIRPLSALLVIAVLAIVTVVGCTACQQRRATVDEPAPQAWPEPTTPQTTDPTPDQPSGPLVTTGPKGPTGPIPKVLPSLDHEPVVSVFLRRGAQVEFTLLSSAEVAGVRIPAGPVHLTVSGSNLLVNGRIVGATARFNTTGARTFRATLTPPDGGKAQTLEFSGTPVANVVRGQVELTEATTMEVYLAGVLPTEMSPGWPVAALAAQAIAARSYAANKWMSRSDRTWQLHWHYTVDMAYGGAGVRTSPAVRQALERTRGMVLIYNRLPVPALFSACSGGRSEAAMDVWPGLTGADGRWPMTPIMPVVEDPAAEAGCKGLGLMDSHWRWKRSIPMTVISANLQAWSQEDREHRPVFGMVKGVEIRSRSPDSGRVADVVVRHQRGKKSEETVMSGHNFRMAVGPILVRSTWWDRCVVAIGDRKTAKDGGMLILAGRGFGHGVGLSQVSAWAMAKQGEDEAAIVGRFYPGASLQDRY